MTRRLPQSDYQRDSKIQGSPSLRGKQGRRVRLRSSTAIWWRSAIDSNCSAVRVQGSLRATGTAALFGIATKAGYRQVFETHADKVLRSDSVRKSDRSYARRAANA